MRTNIVLDDGLIEQARAATGLKKKTEIVDFALRALAGHNTIRKIRKYRKSGVWKGNLNSMRESRV